MLIRQAFINGGAQNLYRFENGYGASVICNPRSHGGNMGLYEIAVIKFFGETDEYQLVYDTPITDDVIGYVPFDEIKNHLQEIKNLPNG